MVLAAIATKLVNYNEAINGHTDVQRLANCCNVVIGGKFHHEIVSDTSSMYGDYQKLRTKVKRFEDRLLE